MALEIKPPRAACEAISAGIKIWYQIHLTVQTIKETMAKVRQAMAAFKFGIVSLDQVVGSLTSLAMTIASKVADAVLEGVSGILKTIFAQIMQLLMSVAMAGPRALLSLVSFPQQAAIAALGREYDQLSKARNAFRRVEYLIDLLQTQSEADQIHNQMREAMRWLDKAIVDFNLVIAGLSNGSGFTFDQTKYRSGMSFLHNAAQVSAPRSVMDESLGITARIGQLKKQYMSEGRKDINTWYRQQMVDAMNKRNQVVTENKLAEAMDSANISYALTVKKIEAAKQSKLDVLSANAEIRATEQALKDFVGGTGLDDGKAALMASNSVAKMAILFYARNTLIEAYETTFRHLYYAYQNYMVSQTMTVMTYNIYSVIKDAYQDLTELVGSISDQIEQKAEIPVAKAMATCETVNFMYGQELTKSRTDSVLRTAKATSVLTAGHMLLETAYLLTDATLNDATLQAMTMDTMATAEFVAYEGFRRRLYAIKDWDGAKGVWARDFLGSAPSPYRTMTISQMQIISMTPDGVRNALIDMRDGIRSLITHNRRVMSVMSSYQPPMEDTTEALRATLAATGLLYSFIHNAMSMSKLAANLQSLSDKLTPDASVEGCMTSYPDLFSSDEFKTWVREKFNDLSAAKNCNIAMKARRNSIDCYVKARSKSGSADTADNWVAGIYDMASTSHHPDGAS